MKTITGIHGVPRSGTSWLAQLFNASPEVNFKFQPLFSYAFKNRITNNSMPKDITSFFSDIENSNDDFINMRDKELLKNYPNFTKDSLNPHLVFKHVRHHHILFHLLKNNELVNFIFIIRNPLAVLNSWRKAPREFLEGWNFSEEWRFAEKKNKGRIEEFFGYEKWKEATSLFMQLESLYPKRVRIVKYEDLLNSTELIIEQLYEFSSIEMTNHTKDFIHESRSKHVNDVNSVFRRKKDDLSYKTEISLELQNEIIHDLENSPLKRFI